MISYSLEELIVQAAEAVRPANRMTVAEASEAFRFINVPGAYVGKWLNDTVPYLVEPMEVLTDLNYTGMVFAGPAQCGKTDTALNWLLHSVVNDPADMMIVQTSRTTARDFSIRRISRLHRDNEDIQNKVLKDNTFDVHYASGMLLTLSWPTINELSGKPIPRLWLTDYDRMPMDVDGEGSPFSLARKRATTFKRHGMTVAESSPGFVVDNPRWVRRSRHEAEPTQGILALYNGGDRRRWYHQCVNCKNTFEPDFELLVYPDTADMMEAAEMAMMACPHCDTRYTHDGSNGLPGKHEMNVRGRWVKDGMVWLPDGTVEGTAIRSDIASFWLKGVAAAFADWKTLVLNYLKAEAEYESTGTEEALKSTVNTDQGKPYLPKQSVSDRVPEQLKSRAQKLGVKEVPAPVRFLIASIDVQKNRFVVQVHGIAENSDVYIVDRFDIVKSKRVDQDGERYWVNPAAYTEDWKLLVEEVMERSYPLGDGSGRRMKVKMTVCDSGGKAGVTANAYDFFRWLRTGEDGESDEDTKDTDQGEYKWSPDLAGRFLLIKGASQKDAPRFAIGYPDSQRKDRNAGARGEVPVGFINTDTLKDLLNNRLDRTDPGGRIVFPDWLSDNFYIELTVEVKDKAKGWINPKRYRNESWDLLVYLYAALLTPQINLAHIDFDRPPGWAGQWDRNDMIYDPHRVAKPFDAQAKRAYSLSKLAENLA